MAQGALRHLRAGRVLRGLRSAIGTESCDPSGWPAQDRVSPQVQSQVPGQGPLPRPEDPQLVATSLWEQKGQAKNPPVGSSGPVWGPARAGLGEPPSWLTARSVLTAGLKAAINQLEVTVPHSVLSSASRTLQPIPSALLCFPGLPCGFPSWRAQGQPLRKPQSQPGLESPPPPPAPRAPLTLFPPPQESPGRRPGWDRRRQEGLEAVR